MRQLRVGNCSGFYGDRLSAMREMLEGGELDVLTGDYLAELTMLILGRDQLKDPSLGYARTFVRQVEDCLGLALERGVKIVSNAGGLNPAGLAARLGEVARCAGLSPSIAYVDGDDVRALGFPGALTANAYLGGFGIAAALRAGADVVVTGRVTDASLVVGPAVAHFGWDPTAYDELAGAVVAGHVLECGAQATGGNFSGFLSGPTNRATAGVPARGGLAGRLVGDHQARRHRRPGHRRHGDGAADVRGAVDALPRPRRDHSPRHRRARRRRARPGTDLRRPRLRAACPAQGLRQRAGRLPQRRRVRADRSRHRGQGRLGRVAARPPADRLVGDLVARRSSARRRRHRGGRLHAAALHRAGRVARPGGPRVQQRRRRARPRVVPRLHDDRSARQRHAVRRLPG